MPRRGAKAPSSGGGPTGGSVTVISGSIRTPDDSDALRVKLSIWDTEVTMRLDGAELGNWEVSEVSIRAIDSTSFEFVAEGDQLIFTPDDAAAFAATKLVRGRSSADGRRARRGKRKPAEPAPIAIDHDSSPAAESRRGKRRVVETPRPAKPSRRERKAAARDGAEREAAELSSGAPLAPPPRRESTVRREAVPTPIGEVRIDSGALADRSTTTTEEPPSVTIPAFGESLADPVMVSEPEALLEPVDRARPGAPPQSIELPELEPEELPEKAPRQKRSLLGRRDREVRPAEIAPADEPTSDEPEEESREKPNRIWIRALDTARKYDFLGLDRVPVNESLRGQEHQHTWDHRVAPSSGPGKHICTICGEIRR